uniref:Tr-type G domain-containing protein n=1 Tax=Rhabditophanes sp. KR3021 TaxID=114890 RepID=A0AC35TGR2_9BILA
MRKENLKTALIGPVGAGKRTVTGQLVYQLGACMALDKLREERERGFTIDIPLWKFKTNEYKVTLFYAPEQNDLIEKLELVFLKWIVLSSWLLADLRNLG